jgi:hypothetical protein
MAQRALPVLSAYLWDLRSQCEAQVRALTDAQRKLDLVRDGEHLEARRGAADQLEGDLRRVSQANLEIRDALTGAIEQAHQVRAGLNRKTG